MERLSVYMSEAGSRSLPAEVMEKTKQHILDTLAAMISGSELPPGRMAIQFAHAYGGREVATVVASNFACGPIEAALTNGMLAHADETDDSHAPSQSHPGCAVIPAALAAGERFGISGERFLRAVALVTISGRVSQLRWAVSVLRPKATGAPTAFLLFLARPPPPVAPQA